MADLSIRIKADVQSAVQQFDDLARSSESVQKQIQKTAESFKTESTERFIDKQKLAGAAVTLTKGSMAALTTQANAYQKEIERLVKSGISPEDAAVTKLQAEYDTLSRKIDASTQGMKSIENVAMAGAAAMAALGAAVAATVQKTAEAGDQYAKNARVIGASAEAYQELIFAADRSGVSSEALTKAMQKLNVQMGDIKNGTGAATKYLVENNKALLDGLNRVCP